MSDIHSDEEAYEAIVDGLNYLVGKMETFVEVTIHSASRRIVWDEDAFAWYVEVIQPRVKEND